ncbi:hypothetical protein [Halovenus marina]|uniref:hypothetical protein n=1 Tax=Halovenus marina TaxID=3396621 RepID=UPI003F549C54
MSDVHRMMAGMTASTRSFVREPFTVVMLVVLPVVSIQVYGVSMGQFPDIGVFASAHPPATTGRITGAVFATGALAGVLGLFQMISARNADHRLTVCGFQGTELVAARFATVVLASLLVSVVGALSLTVLLSDPVGSPVGVFVGLTLAGVIYGLLGILVGSILPRELEGSLFLVILADVDNVFASGLFRISEDITRFAPLSHPHEIVTQAVVDGSFALSQLAPAAVHISVFAVASVLVYSYRVEAGGDA